MLNGALVVLAWVFAWLLLIIFTAFVAGVGGILLGVSLALLTNPFARDDSLKNGPE